MPANLHRDRADRELQVAAGDVNFVRGRDHVPELVVPAEAEPHSPRLGWIGDRPRRQLGGQTGQQFGIAGFDSQANPKGLKRGFLSHPPRGIDAHGPRS